MKINFVLYLNLNLGKENVKSFMARYGNDYLLPKYPREPQNSRDVWAHNLEEEMKNLMDTLKDYKYIAMVRKIYELK